MPQNSPKVPLVRCPKCGRLLPELPPYSVYCCGGCGGFLRAEKKLHSDDDLSESLSEGRPSEGSRGVDNDGGIDGVEQDSERRAPVRVRFIFGDSARKSPLRETNSDGLDDHRNSPIRDPSVESKSSGRSGDGDDRKSPLRERGGGRGKSLAFSVRGGVGKAVAIGRDDRRSGRRENFVSDAEEIEAIDRVESIEESSNDLLQCEPMENRTEGSSSSVSPRRRRAMASHTEDPPIGFGPEMRAERVVRRADGSGKEYGNMYVRSHVEVPYDDWVDEVDDGVARGSRGLRVQDGYVGVFVKPRKRMEQWGDERIRFNGVHGDDEVLGSGAHRRVPVSSYDGSSNYRAELLSKYNKLHEQLIRIGDQISYNGQGDLGIATNDIYGRADDYVYDEYSRVRTGTVRSFGLNGTTRMRPHYISGSPSSSQIQGRTIHHQPPYYHEQFATQRTMDSTYDPRREYLHHPTCPCSNCHAGNLQAHIRTPASAFGHKRSPNSHISPASDYPDAYRKSTLDLTLPKPTHHNPSPHQRSSVDSKSDEGSSAHNRGKRVPVVNQNWKLCNPIAGGAPFVICYNCFQLLRLPGKLISAKKKPFNLQCRSCRTILSLDFNMKKSDASDHFDQTPSKPISADACDVPCEVVTESHHNIRKSDSYEYNGNGYTFPYTDSEPSSELEDRRLISAEAAKRSGFSVPSSQASKDAYSLEAAVSQNDASAEAEKPSTRVLHPLPPPPSSPLRDHMDYIFSTKRSEEEEPDTLNQDKGTAQRESSFVTYVGNAAVPNELEFNYGEIPKTDASQASADTSIGKFQGGVSEASERSFATFRINTSLEIVEVFVNGKPITPCTVKTAEKMAGPISPGEYWYDSTAGFWGVMGGCCLGIIPPCIEEFSSQMPANSSGGKTCIYVNGRELHEFDLDMLSSRGFPRTRYTYYLVDASGKVQDERTGAFVQNLGKLAPTVESTGCGFGMRPPGTHSD